MKVRRAASGDVEAWLALRCALWPERGVERHEHEIRLRLEAPGAHETLVVEHDDGRVTGFAELSRAAGPPGEEPRVRLDAVFVAPQARGQGAARMLLGASERWASSRGAAALVCDVDDADADARAALERLGFGDAARRLHLRRSLAGPIELAERGPGADARPPTEPLLVYEPVRRRVAPVVNAALLACAVASFVYTDLFGKDPFRGVVLPLLDVAFVIYFLFAFVAYRYRQRADSSARIDRLYRDDGDG